MHIGMVREHPVISIPPRATLIDTNSVLTTIEFAGRISRRTEDKITGKRFIEARIRQGEESVLEFGDIVILFVLPMKITRELVRHRIASYVEESTRYINYSKQSELRVIFPKHIRANLDSDVGQLWVSSTLQAFENYFRALDAGMKPQDASDFLPRNQASTIIMKANVREWRYVLRLRGDKRAHPIMRKIMAQVYDIFKFRWPILVEDIEPPEV